jgi:hypothetical protein
VSGPRQFTEIDLAEFLALLGYENDDIREHVAMCRPAPIADLLDANRPDSRRQPPSKTELISRGKPWRCIDDVELATAEWVAWYNQEPLHEALG